MIVLCLSFVKGLKGESQTFLEQKHSPAFMLVSVWHRVCQGESASCRLSVAVNRSVWLLLDGSYCFCLTSDCMPSPGQSHCVFFLLLTFL